MKTGLPDYQEKQKILCIKKSSGEVLIDYGDTFISANRIFDALEFYKKAEHRSGLSKIGYHGFTGFEDIFASFSDIFGDVFEFGAQRFHSRTGARNADLRYDLSISFMDAALGTTTKIDLEKHARCSTCGGSCCAPGTAPQICRSYTHKVDNRSGEVSESKKKKISVKTE